MNPKPGTDCAEDSSDDEGRSEASVDQRGIARSLNRRNVIASPSMPQTTELSDDDSESGETTREPRHGTRQARYGRSKANYDAKVNEPEQ